MLTNIFIAFLLGASFLIAAAPSPTPVGSIACIAANEAVLDKAKTPAALRAVSLEFNKCAVEANDETNRPAAYTAMFYSAVASTEQAIYEFKAKQNTAAAKTAVNAQGKFDTLMKLAFGSTDVVAVAQGTTDPNMLNILEQIYNAEQILQEIAGGVEVRV